MAETQIHLPHNWTPRSYQKAAWSHFIGPETNDKRGVCVWHRRAGKDLMAINLIAVKAFQRVGTYWHLFPQLKQARSAIWNGITSEGAPYLSHIPRNAIDRTYENEMRIKFINGSNYYLVGSDNYNGLMGTNPCGIVLSEYSLQDPLAWQYLSPILRENHGWALFIYTFRGRNHGWIMAQEAKKRGWFYDERIAGSGPECTKRDDGTPVISDEGILAAQIEDRMSEAQIQSEFKCNPDAPIEGAYYAKEMMAAKTANRICRVPYDSRYPVYTGWDIGFDMSVIVFAQLVHEQIRIIDVIYGSEMGLAQCVQKLREKPYQVYEKHFAPWDMDTREWASGKSRMAVAKDLNIQFSVKPQKPDNAGVMDGIEQVRTILNRCWFDETNASMLIEGLRSYHAEKENDKAQFTGDAQNMTVFKTKPAHDWASHFADAMRVMTWNICEIGKSRRVMPDRAEDKYAYV